MPEWGTRVGAAWRNLAPRERLLVALAGAAVGAALVFLLVVRPIQAGRERAADRVLRAEQQLAVMTLLRSQYGEIDGRLSRIERRIERGPRGNIFTTLESLASNSAVKIESLEPQAAPAGDHYREEKVQVVLKGVTLQQMTQYLDQIEKAPQLLSVKSLRIRTRVDKPELLDVNFTVSSFEPS